jgi:hypothetical protein
MREVLHAGLRLGVEVPQVDELRLEIRRREWEELARKVCSVAHVLLYCACLSNEHLAAPELSFPSDGTTNCHLGLHPSLQRLGLPVGEEGLMGVGIVCGAHQPNI